jgi:hypothetical protein
MACDLNVMPFMLFILGFLIGFAAALYDRLAHY